jgi:hypothetical protein
VDYVARVIACAPAQPVAASRCSLDAEALRRERMAAR